MRNHLVPQRRTRRWFQVDEPLALGFQIEYGFFGVNVSAYFSTSLLGAICT